MWSKKTRPFIKTLNRDQEELLIKKLDTHVLNEEFTWADIDCWTGEALEAFYNNNVKEEEPEKDNDGINVEKINQEIKQLTSYGLREIQTKGPGCVVTWSNGSRRWWVTFGVSSSKNAHPILLDANQLYVEGERKDIIEVIDQFEELPLYKYSTEARFGPLK